MGAQQGKDQREELLLAYTAAGNLKEIREALLAQNQVDINTMRVHQGLVGPPVRVAVEKGHMDVLRLLCSFGADLRRRYDDGRNILSVAMQTGRCDLVRYLLLRGCDPNHRCGWYSEVKYSKEVIETLLAFGMRVQVEDLLRYQDSAEVFQLLCDNVSSKFCKQVLQDASSLHLSPQAVEAFRQVVHTRRHSRDLGRPAASQTGQTIVRGWLSYRKAKGPKREKPYRTYFAVLTNDFVLLLFNDPYASYPTETVYLEDYVGCRNATSADCGRSDSGLVLQSIRKKIRSRILAFWSDPVREIWQKAIEPYFATGQNFTGGVTLRSLSKRLDANEMEQAERQALERGPNPFAAPEGGGESDSSPDQVRSAQALIKSSAPSAPPDSDDETHSQPQPFSPADEDEMICKICFEERINIVIIPCGHCCSCQACSQRLETCPICRQPVQRLVKMYQ